MRQNLLQKSEGETGRVSPHTIADVLDTLKEDRNAFLRNVAE
jgi:hypothetical protein